MQYLKPVILITVFRRYMELEANLRKIRAQFHQFQVEPDVVVVWACPEIGRLWFFQELIRHGWINHLVYRPHTGFDENSNISFLESRNLRSGLEYIHQYYIHYYVIGQSADILPKKDTYKLVDTEIQNHDAVLFFWHNGVTNDNSWHTNFFAVKNRQYWPPISELTEHDTLEVQWGKELVRNGCHCFFRSHNSRNQKFDHIHQSENHPIFPFKNQKTVSCLPLAVTGYKSVYRRFKEKFIGVIKWLKF